MSKAGVVAAELRKLADSFERIAEQQMPHVFVHINHAKKESFMALAKVLPRPLQKEISSPGESYAEIRLTHTSSDVAVWSCCPQSLTCELVEPAKPAVYRCDPILSAEEDAALETA